jgi:hypothetical protein
MWEDQKAKIFLKKVSALYDKLDSYFRSFKSFVAFVDLPGVSKNIKVLLDRTMSFFATVRIILCITITLFDFH